MQTNSNWFERAVNNWLRHSVSIRSKLKLRDKKLDWLKGSMAQMSKWCVHATIREEKSFPISRLSRRIHPSWACLSCLYLCLSLSLSLCVCVCIYVCVWVGYEMEGKRVTLLMNWRFLKGIRQQWKENCMGAANIGKRKKWVQRKSGMWVVVSLFTVSVCVSITWY